MTLHAWKRHRRPVRRLKLWDRLLTRFRRGGTPDMVLLCTGGLLVLMGILVLSSASTVESFRQTGHAYFYFQRQLLFGLLPGLILCWVAWQVDYQVWQRYTVWFFAATVGLLLLVYIPGLAAGIGTANSWIRLGPITAQPSELAKLSFILFLAGWFSQRGPEMTKDFWNGLMPFGLILAAIGFLIAKQPDLGTLVVFVAIAGTIYFVAGADWRHIIGAGLLGVTALGILIAVHPHSRQRIMTFLNPTANQLNEGYQINQAFLAIGSGGWFGLGYGQSRQKFAYLPETMGDSIFAILVEELGFIVGAGIVALFGILLLRLMKISRLVTDPYGRYVLVGVAAWIGFQSFFNIGAMTGLLPLTGIPLPFISHGSSALVATLAAVGVAANISKHV